MAAIMDEYSTQPYNSRITWDGTNYYNSRIMWDGTTNSPWYNNSYYYYSYGGGVTTDGGATTTVTNYSTIWTDATSFDYNWAAVYEVPLKPSERLKQIMRDRCAPTIITTGRKPLRTAADIRESRARETLQRVIGESKFRTFLSKGFVSVKAKSDLVYQIFPGHGITNVYNRGSLVERLCVIMKGDFPPTDSLIMRFLMILNNEDQFRSYAVQHGVYQHKAVRFTKTSDQRSLSEIFKELKKVA